jgi:hypothetical protein
MMVFGHAWILSGIKECFVNYGIANKHLGKFGKK